MNLLLQTLTNGAPYLGIAVMVLGLLLCTTSWQAHRTISFLQRQQEHLMRLHNVLTEELDSVRADLRETRLWAGH